MASFDEHCRDCERLIGSRCEDVNHWLDEMFRIYGPLHRFARHHWRGVDEAEKLFGPIGRKAAIVHIMKDCGHVPSARDWEERTVDTLGFKLNKHEGKFNPPLIIGFPDFNGYWDPKEFTEATRKLLDEDSRH